MQLALNFQLLDAEFFLYAALGKGLDDIAPGLFQGPASVGARIANLDVTNFTDSISQHRNRRGIRGMKDEGLRVSRQFGAENQTTSNILSAENEEDYKYNNIRWNWC
ncbi:hypothetical protein QUC31_004815 [Theobroma cacao]